MRVRIDSWADSSKHAHTVSQCSLVHKIIQHVEYSELMARVTKIADMTPHTWGNSLRQQPRVTLSSADSSSVHRALEGISEVSFLSHWKEGSKKLFETSRKLECVDEKDSWPKK